jgi:transcriptional regulator with XRE-family HTH domain
MSQRTFGQVLRMLRVESNMTIKDVAMDSGYAYAQIHNWEIGRVGITLRTLRKLAEYWGVTVSQLVGESPIQPVAPAPLTMMATVKIMNKPKTARLVG